MATKRKKKTATELARSKSNRRQKLNAKSVTKAVYQKWTREGQPKGGTDYGGQHFTPLDFGDWEQTKGS